MGLTPNGESAWVIQGSCWHLGLSPDSPEFAKIASTTCESCTKQKAYPLEEALRHIHSRPKNCDHEMSAHPSQDPCIVWLRLADPEALARQEYTTLITEVATSLLRTLDDIYTECMNVHHFFPSPTLDMAANNPQEVSPEEDAAKPMLPPPERKSRIPKRPGPSELPGLPRNLLVAFKRLVAFYCTQARLLQIRTRSLELGGDTDVGLDRDRRREQDRLQSLRDRLFVTLTLVQDDLILNLTENNASTIRLGAVGPEAIAMAAVMNVQRGALRPGSADFAAQPRGLSRKSTREDGGILTWPNSDRTNSFAPQIGEELPRSDYEKPEDTCSQGPTSLNIISLYASHLAKTELEASINPQRRSFLAIRALEMELLALHDIGRFQFAVLEHLEKVADPFSFRITTCARRSRFPLERIALDVGMRERRAECDQVERMLRRLVNLRTAVKEDLEVLDEGHGNAIRVFTIVTLFFLPL